jgi:pimeloyl-ACP methyl ester carboxylesterase
MIGAMKQMTLEDAAGSFAVTVSASAPASRAVLFGVGRGGNPERHAPLLEALAQSGCAVAAPHFEMITTPAPTSEDLLLRARRMRLAADLVAPAGMPLAGVGHSIGATTLLALAGGLIWLGPEGPLPIETDARLRRLVLMAPPTGFFRAPGALDAVAVPIDLWTGALDTVTPPPQHDFLERALQPRVPVTLHVVDGAGHFSFMDVVPPYASDPFPDRDAFLAQLHAAVCRFTSDPAVTP